jgi:hypothetical protein
MIERTMTNGKFKVTKRNNITDIVRELLRAGYTNGQGFMFIEKFITGHITNDDSLQRYFRNFRRALPMSKDLTNTNN